MSAPGQLYINEICRDVFEKQLDAAFGKDNWQLRGNDETDDVWEMDQFPEVVTVNVMGDKGVIGQAKITSKPTIETNGNQREIQMNPVKIKITAAKLTALASPKKPIDKLADIDVDGKIINIKYLDEDFEK